MRRVTPEGAAAVNRNLDALTTGLAWACMKQQKMPLPLNYECLALSCLHRGLPWLQCRFSRERRRRRHKQGDAAEAVCLSSASRTAVHRARQSDLRAGERFRVQIQKSVASVINPAHGRKHLRWRLSALFVVVVNVTICLGTDSSFLHNVEQRGMRELAESHARRGTFPNGQRLTEEAEIS